MNASGQFLVELLLKKQKAVAPVVTREQDASSEYPKLPKGEAWLFDEGPLRAARVRIGGQEGLICNHKFFALREPGPIWLCAVNWHKAGIPLSDETAVYTTFFGRN